MLSSIVKAVLPAPLYRRVRDLPYALADVYVPSPAGGPVPPLRMQFDGPRGYDLFLRDGREALDFYREIVGLSPDAMMLDIGCGIGRKTLPLTQYLSPRGFYVGVDIDTRGVTWCSRNITPEHPRFVFFRLDVYNRFYNSGGRIAPGKLVLPFPDNSFDVVALWSVFTHMFPPDIAHYLSEIQRVLKPDGKVAASYFLMNEHAQAEVGASRAREKLDQHLAEYGCWTTNRNIPEDCIGIPESWLMPTYAARGLQVQAPVRYGGWANRTVPEKFVRINYQDIVIAAKPR
jgi:SAM-dependent methyltransferase